MLIAHHSCSVMSCILGSEGTLCDIQMRPRTADRILILLYNYCSVDSWPGFLLRTSRLFPSPYWLRVDCKSIGHRCRLLDWPWKPLWLLAKPYQKTLQLCVWIFFPLIFLLLMSAKLGHHKTWQAETWGPISGTSRSDYLRIPKRESNGYNAPWKTEVLLLILILWSMLIKCRE